MRLAGKVAIVTGGGSGIGRATAILFAHEGARVCVVDRDADGGAEVARHTGGLHRISDVGEPGTADADAAAVLDAWGRIDVLVTAAGFSCGGTVTTTDPADWEAVFRANVGGTWRWARAVVPAMQRQGGGAIVTLASQLALAGGRGNSAYIAAKGAIVSLTRTMALDYAGDGIRVNAFAARRHRHAVAAPQLRPTCQAGGCVPPPLVRRHPARTVRPGGGGGRGGAVPRQRRGRVHDRRGIACGRRVAGGMSTSPMDVALSHRLDELEAQVHRVTWTASPTRGPGG